MEAQDSIGGAARLSFRRPRRRSALQFATLSLAIVLVGLALTACDSRTDAVDSRVAARARTSLLSAAVVSTAQFPFAMNSQAARCIVDALIGGVGIDRLIHYGFLNSDGSLNKGAPSVLDLNRSDARTLGIAVVDCAPNNGAIVGIQRNIDRQLPTNVTPQQEGCVNTAITRRLVIALETEYFSGSRAPAHTAFMRFVSTTIRRCMAQPV